MIKEIRKPTGSSNYKPNDIHALLYQQNDLLQRIKSISQKQKNPISHASEHYEHKIRMLQQRHLAKSEIIDLEKQIEEMEKLKHINSEKPQSYMGSYFNNSELYLFYLSIMKLLIKLGLPPPPNAFVKMFWDASQPQ